MAPSSRASKKVTTATTTSAIKTLGFGRVSKASHLNGLQAKSTHIQKKALVGFLDEKVQGEADVKQEDGERVGTKSVCKKRKIDDVESEDDEDDEGSRGCVSIETGRKIVTPRAGKGGRKAKKVQLLSPPASNCGTDSETSSLSIKSESASLRVDQTPRELPSTLRDLLSLHAALLKALSLHYAHNGPSSPAELGELMASMTRIWKKSAVTREIIQRLLALYELPAVSNLSHIKTVEHENGPFKLTTSGLGSGSRTNIEFVGRRSSPGAFEEKKLQLEYERVVQSNFDAPYNNYSAFIHGSISEFPLLAILKGAQTQARQEKASATRKEILQLSNAAQARSLPNFSKLSIDSDQSDCMSTPVSTKSRTSALFDRVRAKGLALSSTTAPTTEQILRRHAIGRIAEVVEFLRMKQQQKTGAQLLSNLNDSQALRGKISFSLHSIVNEIRQSVAIPLGDAEVRCCVQMLSQEVPQWLSCLTMGTVQSITLVGDGLPGFQVKKMIEDKEKRV